MNGGTALLLNATTRRRHSCPYYEPPPQFHAPRDPRLHRSRRVFVTICVHDRQAVFGQIVDGVMHLNALGQIAHECWPDVIGHHAFVELDALIVMPNHVHALLLILASSSTTDVPVQRQFARPIAGSLSTLLGTYKAEVSRRAKRAGLLAAGPLWQRNFWDRIVRDERELENVRNYILTNPLRWESDSLHASGKQKRRHDPSPSHRLPDRAPAALRCPETGSNQRLS